MEKISPLCDLCNEYFNELEHKPISQPCGHVYCSCCLKNLKSSSKTFCQTCKKPWSDELENFPIIYMLIPSSEKGKQNDVPQTMELSSNDYKLCSTHKLQNEYWCCKCSEVTCKKCFVLKHRGHATILPEDLLAEELHSERKKYDFMEGSKETLENLKQSIMVCDSGLKIMNMSNEIHGQLIACKNRLLKQQQGLEEVTKALNNKEDFNTTNKKLWNICLLKPALEAQCQALEQKCQQIAAQIYHYNSSLKEVHNSLSLSMTTILPQEFLPHRSQWKLEGEYEVQKALATLINSDHRPLGSVIVTSNANHPVLNFSPLLSKLAECGVDIKLHLWDSFWSRDLPSNDRDRLKPFLSNFKGHELVHVFGNFDPSTLLKMTALEWLGVRLETAADVPILNSEMALRCVRHVALSRSLRPENITVQMSSSPRHTALHCIELEDGELAWLAAVARSLCPTDWRHMLVLPACRLTHTGVMRLLECEALIAAKGWVYLQSEVLTSDDKQDLTALATRKNITLQFRLPHSI
ncbi:uncharacterized protein LOC108677893 [Hyalella azteca]|uniref:Uncharacterized protein LOC108677893 n=1 Tax=Hyalella azteca TaxID=294128 RepID=A0A8B7P935_HYAAZ|nr:uncharacterized protein LOC108677893 [Hyalella azteca]